MWEKSGGKLKKNDKKTNCNLENEYKLWDHTGRIEEREAEKRNRGSGKTMHTRGPAIQKKGMKDKALSQ